METNTKDYNSVSDILKEVKTTIQAKYPGVKLSCVKRHYNSLGIDLMEGTEPALIDPDKGHIGVNQYYFKESKDLTEYAKNIFIDIEAIIRQYHWDRSDPMTDYFNCAFYYHYSIGKWDKPYKIVQPKEAVINKPEPVQVDPGKIKIIEYSDYSIAVIGDTKPIKDKLRELGGWFKFNLSCGPGWIFKKADLERVKTGLSGTN